MTSNGFTRSEITRNTDGSTIVTAKNVNGTTVVLTRKADGTVTKTTKNADGTSTETIETTKKWIKPKSCIDINGLVVPYSAKLGVCHGFKPWTPYGGNIKPFIPIKPHHRVYPTDGEFGPQTSCVPADFKTFGIWKQ